MSCHDVSRRVTSCPVRACHATRVTWCRVMSCHTVSHRVESYHFHVLSCRVASCHAVLSLPARGASNVRSTHETGMLCDTPASYKIRLSVDTLTRYFHTRHPSGRNFRRDTATLRTQTKKKTLDSDTLTWSSLEKPHLQMTCRLMFPLCCKQTGHDCANAEIDAQHQLEGHNQCARMSRVFMTIQVFPRTFQPSPA